METMWLQSTCTYIGNYGWIETKVSTKHVRESINTLLGVLNMTIDTQMAVVGRERDREGEGGREGGREEGEGGEREREREREREDKIRTSQTH